MDIDEIRKYIKWRKAVWPTGKDALDFAVTEIGEIVDAWLRKYRPNYLRNNDKDANIAFVLADCYSMLEIASHELTGKSLDENLLEKWKYKGYDLKQIESKRFFFGANPHLPNEFLHDIYAGNSDTITDNPYLPYSGILKDIQNAPTIFSFPIATIEKVEDAKDKWWNGLSESDKLRAKELFQDLEGDL